MARPARGANRLSGSGDSAAAVAVEPTGEAAGGGEVADGTVVAVEGAIVGVIVGVAVGRIVEVASLVAVAVGRLVTVGGTAVTVDEAIGSSCSRKAGAVNDDAIVLAVLSVCSGDEAAQALIRIETAVNQINVRG